MMPLLSYDVLVMRLKSSYAISLNFTLVKRAITRRLRRRRRLLSSFSLPWGLLFWLAK